MICQTFASFAFIIAFNCVFAVRRLEVTLSHGGVLVGTYLPTDTAVIIEAYRGIPYAEPPVGRLRFRAPIAARGWKGEKLATKDSDVCVQKDPYQGILTTFGSEDCLYLNVYVPERNQNQQHFPVMVFIHPGAYSTGGGTSQLFKPRRIVENKVILVTMNYRLGPFGFLSTQTQDCPGNNGLKDQALALKWVQNNIHAFGGNPKDVTLFGQSAGAASVTFHMVSPLTKGLFHKAIIQSGTYFTPWALGKSSAVPIQVVKLAQLLRCPIIIYWKYIMECLRRKTADEILTATMELFQFDIYPLTPFSPVVEPNLNGAYLTKDPRTTNNQHSASIPIMIGVTADEGVIGTGTLLHLYSEEFKRRFNELVPLMAYYDGERSSARNKITSEIDKFYFRGIHNWTKQNHQNLTNLFGDRWFNMGKDAFLRKRFAEKNVRVSDTYFYIFDHRGPFTFSQQVRGGSDYYGVCHGDDLFCLFSFGKYNTDEMGIDGKMKWAMPYMWTNFAKTGNPTPPGSNVPKWNPAKKFPLEYARLGNKNPQDWTVLQNEIGFVEERMKFWRNLEKKYQI